MAILPAPRRQGTAPPTVVRAHGRVPAPPPAVMDRYRGPADPTIRPAIHPPGRTRRRCRAVAAAATGRSREALHRRRKLPPEQLAVPRKARPTQWVTRLTARVPRRGLQAT